MEDAWCALSNSRPIAQLLLATEVVYGSWRVLHCNNFWMMAGRDQAGARFHGAVKTSAWFSVLLHG